MTTINKNADEAPLALLADGRQSATALEISRGVMRLLLRLGLAGVAELPLPNGRRADIVGLSAAGEIWILEIKSSVEDFRSDQKWPEYRDFCDRLYFAVMPDFPTEILPAEAGLVLADKYGGEIVRESPESRLSGSRRKSMTLRFARTAALRLALAADPPLAAVLQAT